VRLGVPADGATADVYDLPVAAAVQAFQRANGLPPNGALTPGTAAALSGGVAAPAMAVTTAPSPARRVAMIAANMEMWRWEPHDMGEERIEINIPDFSLRMMDGDNLMHAARVIVGKPDTPTPVFSNSVKYILVNPIWRVPDSIIKKEFAPHLADDPNYLADRGYEVKEVGGRMVVNQLPGDDNALGRIAFMFPNEHDVYLHDTNARGLFGAAHRAFSHGCVRVDQPMALAELVMGGASTGWTSARLQSMLGSSERTVMLPHTIPIHLEYFTEFVDASGALQDREDIYGIAARVEGIISKTSQD
jgi:murein L,D-transpeptidase YcbB/YkuD